ncbi:MAG: malto-oligosyltrehalose trehalohydrolase [Propionibacteriaceae bacterium]|nr:malto-oligosyltrehalose trehalohydrolase [Propionibacteriaceae bacterium]
MRDLSVPTVWAPAASRVELVLDEGSQPMTATGDGWWRAEPLPPGTRYRFSLDGGMPLPDPRSLDQFDGPHQASVVVDPAIFTDRVEFSRDLRGAVLYELHIGTFTPEGTLDAAAERLDHLVALGVDAVELMPVADFPGVQGWGYDGVGQYAVHHAYGGPAALVRFVDECHRLGLGVVLDVVHNHFGPEGNYLAQFGPYFTDAHHTPWGQAVNLDQPGSRQVRDFLLGACRQWLVDFRIDGLRLDAVHELRDDSSLHYLAELSRAVRGWEEETGREFTLFAESDQNQPSMVSPVGSVPGAMGMDAQWADDVHHALHSFFTGETSGYYVDFGSATVLEHALTRVFVHEGGWSTFRERDWGAPVDPDSPLYDGHSFVVCLQNHDQVGNRAVGDRTSHLVGSRDGMGVDLQAAAAALYLLSAFTPLIFMGEEWAASTPFPFFSDLGPELGPLVTDGRRREFERMGWSAEVPDPQDAATRKSAVLRWDEVGHDPHARMLAWYRALLALRREHPELRDGSLRSVSVEVVDEDAVLMRRGRFTIAAFRSEGEVHLPLGTEPLLIWGRLTRMGEGSTLSGPGAVIWG